MSGTGSDRDVEVEFDPEFLYLKAINIRFTSIYPNRPVFVFVRLKSGNDDSECNLKLKSRRFKVGEDVRWKLESLLLLPVPSVLTIRVRQVHRFVPNILRDYATFRLDVASTDSDVSGSIPSVEDNVDGTRALANLVFVLGPKVN